MIRCPKTARLNPELQSRARALRASEFVNMIATDAQDDPREVMNHDFLPDVRDGLTHRERVVLWVLSETQKERGDRNVPTAMLWGRVCEHFYISPEELSLMLARLGARK